MLPNSPEMPQHLLLAWDRHQRLLDEAKKRRLCAALRDPAARPVRWQRVRWQLGEMLIVLGTRLKTGVADTVWG